MTDLQHEVVAGPGYAAGNVDAMGDGAGFRKIRSQLGVNEMGVNAVVLPPGIASGTHWHEQQEEVYFVYEGTLRFVLGEPGDEHEVVLGPGGMIRVDAATQRSIGNIGSDDAMYVCFGAAGGYVGRDGHHREGEPRVRTVDDQSPVK